MELGRRRIFTGNMKAIHKYLNRCYKKEEKKIILICLEKTKPGLMRKHYRSDSGIAIKRSSVRPALRDSWPGRPLES